MDSCFIDSRLEFQIRIRIGSPLPVDTMTGFDDDHRLCFNHAGG